MARAGQLSDRQHAAAVRLLDLHDAAGLEPVVTARYAPRGWCAGHDDDGPEMAPVTEFRALLRRYRGMRAVLLHELCLGQHPGARWLATLQEALSALADMWGIR